MGRRRFPHMLGSLLGRVVKRALSSRILLVFLVLCTVGFIVGRRSLPDPAAIPYDELLDNLSVLSWHDVSLDSGAHFVVELSADGHSFRRYDIDRRCFEAPVTGHEYRRSISGTRYDPLRMRGRADAGFWLDLADSAGRPFVPGQFAELYRKTLDYVKPVSIATNVLGMLSGYSVGFRLATWSSSLSNPAVQERVIDAPGIGRLITREAWRRVLLEPSVVGDESDARAFASAYHAQRLYGNFFKLALRDSDGFIPREAWRLTEAGRPDAARAMVAFAAAVTHAVKDSLPLRSSDFRAIENWAGLLDREGHWAKVLTPPRGPERARYLGTLAWYGLAPAAGGERRIWVGPRMLVRDGDTDGFVADDIAATELGCPLAWRARLLDEGDPAGMSAWTAQWTAGRPEFAPLVSAGRRIANRLRGGQ